MVARLRWAGAHNEVAVHNGTIQETNRDKVLIGAKFNPVIHQRATHQDQRYRTRTRQPIHLVTTCLQPWIERTNQANIPRAEIWTDKEILSQ